MAFWHKKQSEPAAPPASPPQDAQPPLGNVLAETVARHIPGARVDGNTAVAPAGINFACHVSELQQVGGLTTARLDFGLRGGALGPEPTHAAVSGYGASAIHAVVEGGCLWTCTLLEVLDAAGVLPLPDRSAQTGLPDTIKHPVDIHGRRFELTSEGYDRAVGGSENEFPDFLREARAPLGGHYSMARRVVESGTLPVLNGGFPVLLSVFAGTAGLAEVKVHGGDWPAAHGALDILMQPDVPMMGLLRDVAVLVPVGPPALSRESLSQTLTEIGAYRTHHTQAAGWLGWRSHGGRLAPPLDDQALRARGIDPVALPVDYHWYLNNVAGHGAGPGYGLVPPRQLPGGGWLLAEAGDGIRWVLSDDGRVLLDASVYEEVPRTLFDSFSAWHAAWLDNAIAGNNAWVQWDLGKCASVSILSQLITQYEQQGRDTSEIAASVKEGALTLTTTRDDWTIPCDPCQGCTGIFGDFGLPDSVFKPGALRDSAGMAP